MVAAALSLTMIAMTRVESATRANIALTADASASATTSQMGLILMMMRMRTAPHAAVTSVTRKPLAGITMMIVR
jgi:hypothetical protein